MAEERRSLFSRLMEGKEKDENYARSTLPTNRWQLFWDIMKGRFGKIVVVNLLMLIFFIPLIAVVVFRMIYIQTQGIAGPYGSNLAVGYPGIPDVSGVWESIVFTSNTVFFGGIILASFIAAVGLAGGIYVVRNMIWTEGIFVANDFWKGIKLNFFNALEACAFFTIFLFIDVYTNSLADYMTAIGVGSVAWFTVARIACIVVNILAGFMALWMLSLGVNYKQSPASLIKNSFIMTVGTFPQTVVFAVAAVVPVVLIFTGVSILLAVAIIFYILMGFSYALLVWMSYTQWAFDKFVNPNVKGAKVGRGLYNPDAKKDENEASHESGAIHAYKLAIIAEGKSNLMSRPMKPIDDEMNVYELPESFSREDLVKLKESKTAIVQSQKEYEDEHKNDARYVEYNKQFEEREKALQPEVKKNGKVKKKAAPKMLNQRD